MVNVLYSYTRVSLHSGSFELTPQHKLEAKKEFIDYNVIKYDANEENLENFFDVNFDEMIALISIKAKEASDQVINSLKEEIKYNTGMTVNNLFFKIKDDDGWLYYPSQDDTNELIRMLLEDTDILYYNGKFYFDDNECFDSWSKDELVEYVKMIRYKLKAFESID